MKYSKYRNKPLVVDGERFDSKGEYARWSDLQFMEKTGDIRDLRRQVRKRLEVDGQKVCDIVIDFAYTQMSHDGPEEVYEDFKSPATITPIFRLKSKMFKAQYGKEINVSMR